jgi:VWFA-related protein
VKINSTKSAVAWLKLLLLSLVVASQPGAAWAQTASTTAQTAASSPSDQSQRPGTVAFPKPGTTDRRMTLNVPVTDQSGHVISGLQQQDFTLLDNKLPVKIVSFRRVEGASAAPDPPVEVVLVIDEVNTSFHDIAIEREQVEKFLSQNDGKLAWPVSLVFFSLQGAAGGTPSRDGNSLIAELKQHKTPLRGAALSQGTYGAFDRINLSVRTLGQFADYEAKRPGRKLVVWLSPGWSFLSSPRVETRFMNQQGLFNSIVNLSDALPRADITLYNVNPLGSGSGVLKSYYKDFIKGVKTATQAKIGNLALQVLAYQSGGLVLNSSNDLAAEIATCVSDANAFYVLSFETAVGDGPNEYHALELTVNKSGSEARTRSGYYAQPEQLHKP